MPCLQMVRLVRVEVLAEEHHDKPAEYHAVGSMNDQRGETR